MAQAGLISSILQLMVQTPTVGFYVLDKKGSDFRVLFTPGWDSGLYYLLELQTGKSDESAIQWTSKVSLARPGEKKNQYEAGEAVEGLSRSITCDKAFVQELEAWIECNFKPKHHVKLSP